MKFGIFGTGMVGAAIGTKLVQLGHEVKMGSRTKDNPKAVDWVKKVGGKASQGTFADAAQFGELVFNCTQGAVGVEVVQQAGPENLAGKVLIDVANPLDFSHGMPPTLTVANKDSLGEQLQRALPKTQVVKALNTINAELMVEPGKLAGGNHDLFIAGNDAGAKEKVTELVKSFGWRTVIDIGDITGARATESYLLLWIRLMGQLGTVAFNLKVVR